MRRFSRKRARLCRFACKEWVFVSEKEEFVGEKLVFVTVPAVKVTFSGEKMTFTILKVTFSAEKVTFSAEKVVFSQQFSIEFNRKVYLLGKACQASIAKDHLFLANGHLSDANYTNGTLCVLCRQQIGRASCRERVL